MSPGARHGIYHTLVIPQLDFIPVAVAKQLSKFEKTGGKILWADRVQRGAEHAKNDSAVKEALYSAKTTSTAKLAQTIPASFSPRFDLTFTPDTDQLVIGRFNRGGKQVYLLVNRLQKGISVGVRGQRQSVAGKITVLDPSTGKIVIVSLPVSLSLEPNRALILIPVN